MTQSQLANVNVDNTSPTSVYELGVTKSANATEVTITSILLSNISLVNTIEVTCWSVPNGEVRGDEHVIVPSILIPPRGKDQGVVSRTLAHDEAGAEIFVQSSEADVLTLVMTGAEYE